MRTVLLGLLSIALAQTALAATDNNVLGVAVKNQANTVEYTLKLENAPSFYAHASSKKGEVYLDLPNTSASKAVLNRVHKSALTDAVKLSNVRVKGVDVARLTLHPSTTIVYDAKAAKKTVTLTLQKDANRKSGAPRLAQADDDDAFDGEGTGGFSTGGTNMTYIGFRNTASSSRVFARMNKSAEYDVRREGPNLMVLEIQDASIPLWNNKNHLDATYFDSPVRMITPTEVDGDTPRIRIIIEMKQDVPFSKSKEGNDIVVAFQK